VCSVCSQSRCPRSQLCILAGLRGRYGWAHTWNGQGVRGVTKNLEESSSVDGGGGMTGEWITPCFKDRHTRTLGHGAQSECAWSEGGWQARQVDVQGRDGTHRPRQQPAEENRRNHEASPKHHPRAPSPEQRSHTRRRSRSTSHQLNNTGDTGGGRRWETGSVARSGTHDASVWEESETPCNTLR
jgi:hypothetical protein